MKNHHRILNIIFFSVFLFNHAVSAQQKDDSLKNKIGVVRLQTFYDNGQRGSSITSLEYLRRFENKSTVIGRLNYGDRQSGQGFQAEAESYIIHSDSYYSYASLSASNSIVFPELKAGYSLYRNFNKGWEGDLGYRFLRAEKMNMHSLTWSAGKYLGNFWLNMRGYFIHDVDRNYQSYRLTSRYYLNDQLDYLTLMLSTGTSPDDRSRNFTYSSFGTFLSKSIGAGYKRSFGDFYQGSVIGAWNSQKIADNTFLNQFDISLSIYRKF